MLTRLFAPKNPTGFSVIVRVIAVIATIPIGLSLASAAMNLKIAIFSWLLAIAAFLIMVKAVMLQAGWITKALGLIDAQQQAEEQARFDAELAKTDDTVDLRNVLRD